MRAIEIGRRLGQLGETQEALKAYELSLEKERNAPLEEMEAAVFVLENGGNYHAAYDGFLRLYEEGQFQEDILSILTGAFYVPNSKALQKRYERNVKELEKYPYLFRRDFPAFEDLPVLFFPYDEDTYVPLDTRTGAFLPKFAPGYEEITRNFFRDLEKPILASDVFSQYELEYLNDNVRRSEDVGRENHIYLHYTDWGTFCSYLQIWNLRPLLKAKKAVFLIEDELSQYPLDFAARFGVDYSQYPVKPVGIREVTRLIWHTQLSAHNGGDFFNEIFDYHPNLLFLTSIWMHTIQEELGTMREALRAARSLRDAQEQLFDDWGDPRLVEELYRLRNPSDKDLLVAMFLGARKTWSRGLDPKARIAPAVFFQPHFPNMVYQLSINQKGDTELTSQAAEKLRSTPLFREFKYVKTFTPVRRFTGSFGGSMRFFQIQSKNDLKAAEEGKGEQEDQLHAAEDFLSERVLNRSFMVDPEDRMFRDSVIVRLEDGKLNPKATLSALASFLDLPYTQSMTYCSSQGSQEIHPEWILYAHGFSTKSVYNTFDAYMGEGERLYIEYFLRDAYAYFGYDFQTYDGAPVDDDTVKDWLSRCGTLDQLLREVQERYCQVFRLQHGRDYFTEEGKQAFLDQQEARFHKVRWQTAMALSAGLRFVNKNGRPLVMGRLLRPDSALLEQPLYH